MADVNVIASGAWTADAATVWSTGAVPATGDNIIFTDAFLVTMDMTATPVLNNITSAGQAGQILCDTSARSYTINANLITPGTVGAGGFIRCTGDGANTFVLNAELGEGASIGLYFNGLITSFTFNKPVKGGTATNMYGVYCVKATQPVVFNDTVTGGSGATAYGYYNYYAGVPTFNADIYGGTGAPGIFCTNATPTFGANVDLINSAAGYMAYYGKTPTWSPGVDNTITYGTNVWALRKAAAELKKGVHNGGVTGTYEGGPYGVTP